ncbi:MAG: hypothetical protein ACT4PS_16230 [Betaproteobacteria bacterium]
MPTNPSLPTVLSSARWPEFSASKMEQTLVVGKKTYRTGLPGRKRSTFAARDSKGNPLVLDVYQEFIDAGTRDDPHAERRGRWQVMTGDGRRVEKIATRRYRVIGSTDILTSDDPNAP